VEQLARIHPGLPADVWQAPQEQVEAIYWNALACDQLPAGVDYCVFDYGVNSGNSRAAVALQQFVGTTVDGEIGPLTIAAAACPTGRTGSTRMNCLEAEEDVFR
jgi:lysozyme family protein